MKRIYLLSIAFIVLCSTGCYKEYTNPSAATDAQILNNVNGLISTAVGIQNTYSGVALYSQITIAGFATKELRLLNPGNTAENDLLAGGGAVLNTNSRVSGLWTSMNRIVYSADNILNNSKIASGGVQAGLNAHAYLFKALAVGAMATFWTNLPVQTGTKAQFVSRIEALKKAVEWLKAGEALVPNITSAFTNKVPSGIDYKNTFPALLARYYNMLGDNDNALSAANRVDITAKSYFSFDAKSPNQVFYIAIGGINVYQPADDVTFGLPASLAPSPNDKRIGFYTYRNAGSASDVRGKGFFTSVSSVIPLYLPGEITLIKAEAYARKGSSDPTQLANAITELNKVLTKTTDAWGIGASLPPYTGNITSADILTEVYRNRRMELFMSGLELEDCRRFGRPGPDVNSSAERNRTFYPFPLSERANNPNTPPDPAF